tara:strand:- start:486 stop:1205 length:720 start_codon:yes stop_codon:yes gene_type:complete
MAKSSIHIKPVKSNSENHNLRKVKLDYVREDLTALNKSYSNKSISESLKELKTLVKGKTGRKMQAKATPIREGVFLFNKNHTNDDIIKIAGGFKKYFGIMPIQIHIHRDEGHYQKLDGEWKPNYHAHIIFEWIDRETGRSVKLNRDEMSKMQSYVAQSLNMERGKSSSKKHLSSIQWKVAQKEIENVGLEKEIQQNENTSLFLDVLSTLRENNPDFENYFQEELTKRKKAKKKMVRRGV